MMPRFTIIEVTAADLLETNTLFLAQALSNGNFEHHHTVDFSTEQEAIEAQAGWVVDFRITRLIVKYKVEGNHQFRILGLKRALGTTVSKIDLDQPITMYNDQRGRFVPNRGASGDVPPIQSINKSTLTHTAPKTGTESVAKLDERSSNQETSINEVDVLKVVLETLDQIPANGFEDVLLNTGDYDELTLRKNEESSNLPRMELENCPEVIRLRESIMQMRIYGIKCQKNSPDESEAAISLAEKLNKRLQRFLDSSKSSILDHRLYLKFKKDFLQVLHSKDDVFANTKDRFKMIVNNIMIALTGVGALVLAGKLLYSYIKTGHSKGFFNGTPAQSNVKQIEARVNDLPIAPSA